MTAEDAILSPVNFTVAGVLTGFWGSNPLFERSLVSGGRCSHVVGFLRRARAPWVILWGGSWWGWCR